MQTDSFLIPVLFFFLFVAAIALATSQNNKAKRDAAQHHRSAQNKIYDEQPADRHGGFGSSATMTAEQATQRSYSPNEQPSEWQGSVFGSGATMTTEETTPRPYSPHEQPNERQGGVFGSGAAMTTEETTQRP